MQWHFRHKVSCHLCLPGEAKRHEGDCVACDDMEYCFKMEWIGDRKSSLTSLWRATDGKGPLPDLHEVYRIEVVTISKDKGTLARILSDHVLPSCSNTSQALDA